jgi:hypothetical protein
MKKIEKIITPFGKTIKKIISGITVIDETKPIEDRVKYGLKFLGIDINKLVAEKGIQISLGIGRRIGFSGFLTEMISIGKLPELNLAFVIAPILFENFLTESRSLYPELSENSHQRNEFIQLIVLGGKNKKKRTYKKKKAKKNSKENKTRNKKKIYIKDSLQ